MYKISSLSSPFFKSPDSYPSLVFILIFDYIVVIFAVTKESIFDAFKRDIPPQFILLFLESTLHRFPFSLVWFSANNFFCFSFCATFLKNVLYLNCQKKKKFLFFFFIFCFCIDFRRQWCVHVSILLLPLSLFQTSRIVLFQNYCFGIQQATLLYSGWSWIFFRWYRSHQQLCRILKILCTLINLCPSFSRHEIRCVFSLLLTSSNDLCYRRISTSSLLLPV